MINMFICIHYLVQIDFIVMLLLRMTGMINLVKLYFDFH